MATTVYTNNQYYNDIATAIRNKNGSNTQYKPSEMAGAINALIVSGSAPRLQSKTIDPTTSQQIINYDSGYNGLSSVTVNAISPIKTATDITVSGATVSIPAGYYSSAVSKSVASGSVGAPIASKGTVSNNSISITPSVTNTTGYITGGTKTGTAVTVSANELVSGTLSITTNGTKNVANYASVNVNVPTGSTINNQNKTVTPSTSSQSISADSGYTGLGTVTVNAIPAQYIVPSGSQTVTSNNTYDVTSLAEMVVNVSTGSTINNQNKTVTPTTSQQSITADSGYTGLGTVIVSAMPTMTLPTSASSSATNGFTSKATIGRSTSDRYINIPTGYNSAGGYYKISAVANGSVANPTAIKGTVSNNSISITPSVTSTTGYITGGTKTGTAVTVTASELVSGNKAITANGTNIDVKNYATVSVAVPSSGTTINNQNKDIAPTEEMQQITADDGYTGLGTVNVGAISSTYVGSGIARKDSSNLTASGATVTVPAGYYEAAASKAVASMSLPTTLATSATSGYTKVATVDRSTSTRYINIPAGYHSGNEYYQISAVANGSVTNSGSASGSSATISTGTNTITLQKAVSITPAVTAGYISSGTAGNVTVSLTASVTTKAATTYNTSTSNQTIAAGTYLTDAQTIRAVTHTATAAKIAAGQTITIGDSGNATRIANISGTFTSDATAAAADIVSGETAYVNGSKITGSLVVNKYYTGSSAPSSSLGSNGDIYIQK